MRAPRRFQPLLPEPSANQGLLEQAAELVAQGHQLEATARGLSAALAPLLRSMNSYYSNRIEGQHTRPAEIERALSHSFDADRELARKQRLAVAHIQAETELERTLPLERAQLYATDYVKQVHAELYRRLPDPDRTDDAGAEIVPGA